MTLVLDASAAAAVLFREPEAERFLDALAPVERIWVPQIFFIELANVGRSKVLRRILSSDEALACLSEVRKWPIEQVEVDWVAAWAVAGNTGLTLYDASYIAAARTRRCRLLTLDGQILSACKKDCVVLL